MSEDEIITWLRRLSSQDGVINLTTSVRDYDIRRAMLKIAQILEAGTAYKPPFKDRFEPEQPT